jgi:hypothetical protein
MSLDQAISLFDADFLHSQLLTVPEDAMCDLLKCKSLDHALRPKCLNFDMAITEKLDLVVRAWTANGDHDCIANAFQIKQNSGVLQSRKKFEQLFQSVHAFASVAGKYIGYRQRGTR